MSQRTRVVTERAPDGSVRRTWTVYDVRPVASVSPGGKAILSHLLGVADDGTHRTNLIDLNWLEMPDEQLVRHLLNGKEDPRQLG